MKSQQAPWLPAPRYIIRKLNALAMLKRITDINTFVDVGFGAGDFACELAKRGYRGKGYDFSEEGVEMANRLKSFYSISDSTLTFENKDVQTMKEKADLVVCFEVLEHIEDDQNMFQILKNSSKKYMLIAVPAHMKRFDYSDKQVGHFRRYEKKELKEMFENNGVEVLDFINYGYPFTLLFKVLRDRNAKDDVNSSDYRSQFEDRSKQSGLNGVHMSSFIYNYLYYPLIYLMYLLSKPFNRTDLAEGYLVLGRIK